MFLLAVLACIFMTRRYEASGVFELQKSAADSLDLADMMGGGEASGASDSLTINVDLQTQADILQSDTLAIKVIKELDLEHNKDFQPSFSPLNAVLSLVSPKGPADPPNAPLEESPHRRVEMLRVFSKNLTVKVNSGTRLIEVDYSSRDPKVAAAVVNHLVQALIDYTFQTKFTATNQVSSWLEGQLGDLRKQSEDLQSQVVALQQGSGIFGVGGTDLQGKPVVYSPILDQLQQSTALLAQAEMSRVLKESVYEVAKTGNPELISQLAGTSMIGQAGQGVANSLTLIQSLRGQEATLTAQIGQDSTQFGAAYPKLVQERESLKSVQKSLQDEIARMGERAKNDYDIALQTQAGAKDAFETNRKAAEALNDKTIGYTILSKEADQSQELYQDLLKRLKEAGILEGLHSSNLTVVDAALAPDKPNRPKVPLYLSLGLVLGIFFGGCAALVVDAVDNKVQGSEEIENLQLPLLGILPQIKAEERTANQILLDAGYSAFSEAVRSLRSTLLISRSGTPPQVLLVTSGSPREGKSTLSLNLAASLAQYNKRVLLVEADLRRPVLGKRLGLTMTGGMSTLLADKDATLQTESIAKYPTLFVLPAGPVPPYPAELLGSSRLVGLLEEFRKSFDFIVLDSPPILPVTDAQILESLADATVLVARAGLTTRVALQRAYNILLPHVKDPESPSIGVVLNSISVTSAAYYGYYGYYGTKKYEYRQKGDEDEKA
jgi:capsular exopolysaccharide synthesis family protein